MSVLSRSSETKKLYDPEEVSMDLLVDFSPMDTSMFFKPILPISLDFPTAIDCPES